MDRLLSMWNVKVHEVRLETKTKENVRQGSVGPVRFLPSQQSFLYKNVFCFLVFLNMNRSQTCKLQLEAGINTQEARERCQEVEQLL